MKPPSGQLYVENHRAHEVMLGCQQSVRGNSDIIIGASIMVGHSDRHAASSIHVKEYAAVFSSSSFVDLQLMAHSYGVCLLSVPVIILY